MNGFGNGCNVYDFDKTIYNGDSSIDLFLFTLKRYPIVISTIPRFLCHLVKYRLRRYSKEDMKESFFSFLKFIPNINALVEEFWDANEKRVFSWYKEQLKSTDVIVSASPEFLIKPLADRLGIKTVIATQVEPSTGRFLGPNCRGLEKVRRLKNQLPDIKINGFYSDSNSDLPLAKLACQAYRIKNGRVVKWIAQ